MENNVDTRYIRIEKLWHSDIIPKSRLRLFYTGQLVYSVYFIMFLVWSYLLHLENSFSL